eukprot:364808-Chlamydomonas_euryale.AAC.7
MSPSRGGMPSPKEAQEGDGGLSLGGRESQPTAKGRRWSGEVSGGASDRRRPARRPLQRQLPRSARGRRGARALGLQLSWFRRAPGPPSLLRRAATATAAGRRRQ